MNRSMSSSLRREPGKCCFNSWYAYGILSAAVLTSCAVTPPPIIPTVYGSDEVRISNESGVMDCERLDRITVQDGIVNGGPRNYAGTMERVEQLLRNEAVHVAANTVVIEEQIESLGGADDGRKGFEIKAYARGYSCPY
jgi:hypothetical protein